ncbi:helix-turn-helix domain containing protein [Mariniblastus sp.]|nr:helix-turn-helix domain containing protein [Mariniblastus sp.]
MWRPDARGNYTRQIGWILTVKGKRSQPKFNLGSDKTKALEREQVLKELWDQVLASTGTNEPLWPEDLLSVAKAAAAGTESILISRLPDETPVNFAKRFLAIKGEYPGSVFSPNDPAALELGSAVLAELNQQPTNSVRREEDVLGNSLKTNAAEVTVENSDDPTEGDLQLPTETAISQASTGPTLFDAFESFQEYLKEEFYRPETQLITPWGQTQIRQVNTLKQHLKDRSIATLDGDGVTSLFDYWRRRPCKLGKKEPMTAKSASNYVKVLKRFFKWLDRTSQYAWRKPFAFHDLETRVQKLPSDYAKKGLEQVETFSLDELKLLMRYGQPLDRLLVLLALNCGFGRAEIATVLGKEIQLFQGHTERHCEILAYQTTDEDSFIKRVRRKSGVYGEYWLFPLTVQGIQWAIEDRKRIIDAPFGDEDVLLLNGNGKPFDHPTKGNNANQTIPNRFVRLIQRIQDDGNQIRKLSFGKLRKTATQLIKNHSDGEIAGVFDCHGQPVESDSLSDQYSNRPFGKVFEASKAVNRYLQPVLRQAGHTPFAKQAEAYTQRKTIDKIIRLYEEGVPTGQIASVVRLHGETVARHIKRYQHQLSTGTLERPIVDG